METKEKEAIDIGEKSPGIVFDYEDSRICFYPPSTFPTHSKWHKNTEVKDLPKRGNEFGIFATKDIPANSIIAIDTDSLSWTSPHDDWYSIYDFVQYIVRDHLEDALVLYQALEGLFPRSVKDISFLIAFAHIFYFIEKEGNTSRKFEVVGSNVDIATKGLSVLKEMVTEEPGSLERFETGQLDVHMKDNQLRIFSVMLMAKLKNNWFTCTSDDKLVNLRIFLNARLLNHSCVSNCLWHIEPSSDNPNVVQFTAKTCVNVAAGEELTIPYLDLAVDCPEQRMANNVLYLGFACECPACDEKATELKFPATRKIILGLPWLDTKYRCIRCGIFDPTVKCKVCRAAFYCSQKCLKKHAKMCHNKLCQYMKGKVPRILVDLSSSS